ncbi:hypothetical protein H7J86_01305 [Mycobacterium hackensackense]|uniref:hypothetical protein n=1 Tax=Mycobacterium hackensackense TaxID=228909 RepID=UPI0022658F6B|nr:hypothetical protein [Mycobacterium hackensackense]MCV7250794.1 hypothetical protein [Mycobacterium hackensackense]
MAKHRADAKSEEDVTADPQVASNRANEDGDGAYVGRTTPEDALDAGESGAEARSAQSD